MPLNSIITLSIHSIVQNFDKTNRNWRNAVGVFDNFVLNVSKIDFYGNIEEIKMLLFNELKVLFGTALIQTYPFPNIGRYVENAIRNIKKRY